MRRHALNSVSAPDALVASLRARIWAGDFVPGTALADGELAEEYGVARPTARAAVQALVHEGLLRREPRRSAYVPRLTAGDIRDLFYVRIPLEIRAVETLVERRAVPKPASQAVDRLVGLDAGAPWADAVAADMSFHGALIAGAGSLRLERTYSSLQGEIRLALAQLQPAYASVTALATEHRELLDAIALEPKHAASRLMSEHLQQAVDDLTSRVKGV